MSSRRDPPGDRVGVRLPVRDTVTDTDTVTVTVKKLGNPRVRR